MDVRGGTNRKSVGGETKKMKKRSQETKDAGGVKKEREKKNKETDKKRNKPIRS